VWATCALPASLPGVHAAKINHGARTSVLHAYLVRDTGWINRAASRSGLDDVARSAVEIS
jgi:hypothetical protein